MNIEYFLDHLISDNEETEDVDLLFSTDEDSSESSDQGEIGPLHATVPNFIGIIESYSETDFKSHFRLYRATVLILIDKYNQRTADTVSSGRPKIEAKLDLYMFLWYIANTLTFRQLANLFGVAKSTAWNVVVRVSNFLVDIGSEYLKWPSHEEARIISRKFEQIKKIPNIIGVIDGTHIRIKAPREHSVYYYNRKKYFSIALQVVADSKKRFIDVYCGEPGSYHDGRVLRRSTLFKEVEENMSQYFGENQFILGDSAYPIKEWLVPPYKDHGALTDGQREFNKIHSSTRVLVENAIGLLKTRFRRLLHFTENNDLMLISKIVYSACVLHNICLMQNDVIDEDVLQEEDEINTENVPAAVHQQNNRRERLFIELQEKNII